MSSTGHLPELESLRSQVADLARELAERDRAMQTRQQADAAQHEVERRLRFTQFAVDHAVDGVLWADESRRFIYANDAVCRSLGYSREELLGLRIADIAPHHDPERFQRRLDEIKRGGAAIYESVHRRKDGTEFPVETSVTYLEHEGKGYTCGIIRDITARKRIEQERLQALSDLQNITETVPDIMFTLDTGGNLIRWNGRLAVVTGYRPEELLNKPALAFVPVEEQAQTAEAIQRAVMEGHAELDGHLLTKAGHTIPYHWTGAALRDQTGRIIGVTGIGRDISDRKRSDEALRESETRFRTFLDHAPGLAFIKDLNGHYLYVNRPFEQRFQLEPGSSLGKSDRDLFSPEQAAQFATHDRTVLESETSAEFEEAALYADGPHTSIVMKFPLKASSGHVYALGGLATDITARKNAETELAAQRYHLLEAQALAHVGSSDWDIDSGEITWSDEHYRILGYEPNTIEITYDTFLSALLPDDHDRVLGAINDALLGKAPYNIECRIVRPTGEIRTIYCRGEVTRGSSGHPLRMSGTVLDITDRKQIEEALRASEERWHLAVQGSNDGIWDWNIPTGDVFFSPRWKAMRGFQDHELRNHIDEWRSRIHPDDLDRVLQSIDHYLAKQTSDFCEEYRVQRKDGSYMWILDRGMALWSDDGTPLRIAGSETDITERKRAEEALAQSRDLLTSFVEHTPAAVAMLDKDFRYLAVSHRWLQDYRLGDQNLTGRHHYDVFPEIRQMTEWQAIHQRCLAGAVERCDEDRLIREDGSEDWLQWEVRPWQDVTGEIGGIIMFTDVITERKRAEVALRESEARTRSILETALDAVISINERGRIIGWNPQAEVMFGYSPHEALGLPLDETIIPARYRQDHAHGMNRMLQSSDPSAMRRRFEFFALHRDGHEFPVEFAIAASQVDGQPMFTAFIRDISERKRAEAALRISEEQLRQALQASSTGLWDWNTDTNEVSLSREWKRQLGYEEEELANTFESWETRLHPEDHDRALMHVRSYLANPAGGYQQEFRLQHKDGTYRWIQARASLVTEPNGRRVRLLGSHVDITDRKRTEEALQRSERQLRTVLDTLPIGVWFTDEKGHVLYGNPVGQRIWADAARVGLPQPEGDRLWWETIDNAESLHRWAVGTVLARGHDVPNEMLEIETNRGDRRTIRNTAVPVKGDAGKILGAIVLNEDITDRVRAEQALRQEHALLMAVMDAATDIIFVKDIAGRYIHMNRAGAQRLGMSVDEVIGWNEYALWPSDLAASCQLADRRVLESGEPITVEESSVSDGETTIYLTTKAPYRDPDGRIIGVIGVARDITERKQAEEALRASEERFAKAFRSSPYPIIISEVESGLFIDANDAAFRSFGYRHEEVANRTSTEFQLWPTPDHRRRFVEHLQQAGAIRNLEIDLRMRSGELRHCLVSAELIELHGKRCMVTVGSDITEQKLAEQNLQQSHAFIRQIIDTDPNFIFAKDRDGRFTLVNRAYADAYGTTVDKLIGRTDADVNRNAGEVASFLSKDRDVIEHLQDQFIPEERITDATGAIRWLQTVKRPILDEAGRATMILGASTDITERKRIEEALRQRERDLRAALEERERISQDLHDGILQSLYAVGLGLEACKPLMTHRHYKKAVTTMTEAIRQLNYVMSEVRNFIAGLESHVLQGSTFPVALQEMVDTLAATHPLRCRVTLDKTAADHISTEQALHLLNIVREALSNSLRHAQATKATVALKPLSRFIRLSITDNGIGFDPASMHGVGHGLTNMAARARKVGGRFAIRSVPQHGTRITIDLPKEKSDAESESEYDSTAARR